MKRMKLLLYLILFILMLNFSLAYEIYFNSSGSYLINISINYNRISDIYFNISGEYYNGYPENISIDIGNDGFDDWEYKIYHSNISLKADEVYYSFSSNSLQDLTFFEMKNNTPFYDLYELAFDTGFYFTKRYSRINASLGMVSSSSISEGIISILTNQSNVQAFIPDISAPTSGAWGLYVAQGGSTYYCNSNHTFNFIGECNLSVEEAMNEEHLAREANITFFNSSQIFRSSRITDLINQELEICSFPCNITVNISSESAGKISLNEIITGYVSNPANITLVENESHYIVNVSGEGNETIYYFYGEKPNVYIVPVIASDDSFTLDENQSIKFRYINNTLVSSWDNLTNYNFPLSFEIYQSPVRLPNFSIGDSYSIFLSDQWNWLFNEINVTFPGIVIILDIKDYFNISASNTKRSPGEDLTFDQGIISSIYINGFTNKNNLSLMENSSEILLNIILHELGHTFIEYPFSKDKFFYTNHPASFSNISGFSTYNQSESPLKKESYFDIYSVMNQLRVYLTSEEIGRGLEFSSLDKMLIGILSPEEYYNYTLYSGNLSYTENKYVATEFTPELNYDLRNYYSSYPDNQYWDVRTYSSLNSAENTTFLVNKLNQNNKSLFIIANNSHNPYHIKVFNNNAVSNVTYNSYVSDNDQIKINILSPMIGPRFFREIISDFIIRTNRPVVLCNLTLNEGITNLSMNPVSNTIYNLSIGSLSNDTHAVRFYCEDIDGYKNDSVFMSFKIDRPPVFTLNYTEWDWENSTNLSYYFTEELQNLSDVKFSNSEGKINFLEVLDLTREIDLRDKIKIIRHKLWINSSLIPEFNKSAQLTFNNINLSLPIVKKDGFDCLEEDCFNQSFDSVNERYIFNVSGFSMYEIVEQCDDGTQNYNETGIDCGGPCSSCATESTSSSGGGGGGSSGGTITSAVIDTNNPINNESKKGVIKEDSSEIGLDTDNSKIQDFAKNESKEKETHTFLENKINGLLLSFVFFVLFLLAGIIKSKNLFKK